MTWTKLSDDYADTCASLSDAAFRTHTEALIWTMRRETGGYITDLDIRRCAESPHTDMAVEELVACGWWVIERQGYRIKHHMEHQAEPEVIAARRQMNAERQRRHRMKKAGISEPAASLEEAQTRPVQTRPDQSHASHNDVHNASRNGVTEGDPRFWKTPEEMRGGAQ